MDKRKPTFYTKSSQAIVFFCILAITIFVSSCSQELFEEQLVKQNKIVVTEKPFSELEKDKKFNQLMRNLTGIQQVSRSVFEKQNGFTIAAAPVKVIQTDSVNSYTMLVERDVPHTNATIFENLVIQEDTHGNTNAFILKYLPKTISTSSHNSFTFRGQVNKTKLPFTGFNKSSNNFNTTQSGSDCVSWVLWCTNNYPGETGGHIAGADCTNSNYLEFRQIQVFGCDQGGGGTTGDEPPPVDINIPANGSDNGFGGNGGSNSNNFSYDFNNDPFTAPVLTIDNPRPQSTPCPGDPIKNPKICPSSTGNIKGGTYGCTRYSNTICNGINGLKKHGGVDIAIQPHEILYVMYSGYVVDKRATFQYNQYKKNSLGNYVEIESTINNQIIRIKYCHLGDVPNSVSGFMGQGFPFALSGKSGNAAAPSVTPHLHIQAKMKIGNNWVEIDPLPLFDTIFDSTTFEPIDSKSNCQ